LQRRRSGRNRGVASALGRKKLAIADNNMMMNRGGGSGAEDTGIGRHVCRGSRVKEPVAAVATGVVDGQAVEGGVEADR